MYVYGSLKRTKPVFVKRTGSCTTATVRGPCSGPMDSKWAYGFQIDACLIGRWLCNQTAGSGSARSLQLPATTSRLGLGTRSSRAAHRQIWKFAENAAAGMKTAVASEYCTFEICSSPQLTEKAGHMHAVGAAFRLSEVTGDRCICPSGVSDCSHVPGQALEAVLPCKLSTSHKSCASPLW